MYILNLLENKILRLTYINQSFDVSMIIVLKFNLVLNLAKHKPVFSQNYAFLFKYQISCLINLKV